MSLERTVPLLAVYSLWAVYSVDSVSLFFGHFSGAWTWWCMLGKDLSLNYTPNLPSALGLSRPWLCFSVPGFCDAGDWTRALCMCGNTANQATCSACIMSVLLVYMSFICHGPGPVTCQLSGMRFFRSQGHYFLSSLNFYPTKVSSEDSNIHLALTGRVLGLPYAYEACLWIPYAGSSFLRASF